jgi:hypothetical protein
MVSITPGRDFQEIFFLQAIVLQDNFLPENVFVGQLSSGKFYIHLDKRLPSKRLPGKCFPGKNENSGLSKFGAL